MVTRPPARGLTAVRSRAESRWMQRCTQETLVHGSKQLSVLSQGDMVSTSLCGNRAEGPLGDVTWIGSSRAMLRIRSSWRLEATTSLGDSARAFWAGSALESGPLFSQPVMATLRRLWPAGCWVCAGA